MLRNPQRARNEGNKMQKAKAETEKRAAGTTKPSKAEMIVRIVEFMWHLKKQGYAESTVRMRTRVLKQLVREGANLLDPESVKKVIASHDNWTEGYKLTIVNAYDKFLEMQGLHWDPPCYNRVIELPFIPLERELDDLIAGCGKKVAASLQLMKETAMRIGEVWQLKWTDIDQEKRTIKCRSEKHGNPRMFKVSAKLITMLNALPKTSEKVFGGTSLSGHRWNFTKQKRRLARKLQNPRLNQITFHTFRHWKATMEYHRTKDILHVKRLLGHRKIESTLVYTQLVEFERDDEFICKTASTLKEAEGLIEAGFEYVTDMDGVKLFRKRK
jgi:integrase